MPISSAASFFTPLALSSARRIVSFSTHSMFGRRRSDGSPLAGDAAYLLFAVGLIGTGLLAVPVLAGSASFAIAEVFHWRSGLDLSPWRGRWFYMVFAGSVIGGMALNLAGTNAIHMLFLSALINGLLAPPLLLLVMLVGGNRAIMGERTSGPWLSGLGWLTTLLMFVAAAAFLVTSR